LIIIRTFVRLLFIKYINLILHTVTIKDIAKALHISTSTVSRALRDSYEINAETKRLVLEYAEKINYRPNPIALSLKENRSRAIGVIVPEIANNYYAQAISGIEAIAYNRGYHVIIFQSYESFEREMVNIAHIVARKVDGLIISLSGSTTDVSHLKALHEQDFPIVFFDRITDEINTYKVVADNFKGAFEATEHLILSGRRNIALVSSHAWLSITKERMEGYKAALDKYHIPINQNMMRNCGFNISEVQAVMTDLLTHHPDAIFTTSDRLTLSCLEILQEKQVKIPQAIAFVGFTNLTVAHLLAPSLSVVVQPAFEMGYTATDLLLDMVEQKPQRRAVQTIVLGTELIVRGSSG
jgi:LacI family transcriptional regulator